MVEEPTPQSPLVAQAEAWGNANARFLYEVYSRWQVDGVWPEVEDLGRQGLREKWDFDAFSLGESIPLPLGRRERGPEERISLRLRALSFIPPAWPLMHDVVKAIIKCAKLYVEAAGKPQFRSEQLTEVLGFDSRRAAQVGELLLIEHWIFGGGGGSHDEPWWRDLNRSCRFLTGVENPDNYFRVEDERRWANHGAPFNPLMDGPIGDELPVEYAPAPQDLSMAPPPMPATRAPTTPARATPQSGAAIAASGLAATSATDEVPSVFISYAHKDKALARAFADGLEAADLQVWIDDNELLAGDSIIEQIAKAVADIDFFCALVSDASHESKWCQQELNLAMTQGLVREGAKVIPLRVGHVTMPASIIDRLYVQLDPGNVSSAVERIVRDVRKHRERRRTLGDTAATQEEPEESEQAMLDEAPPDDRDASVAGEPIRIVGLVAEGVGTPRRDCTTGSELYIVPLRLNREPSALWTEQFLHYWEHPPRSTSKHRRGIASVQGDSIVLDGTTLDELQHYHLATLRLAIECANSEEQRIEEERRREEAQHAALADEHRRRIAELDDELQSE